MRNKKLEKVIDLASTALKVMNDTGTGMIVLNAVTAVMPVTVGLPARLCVRVATGVLSGMLMEKGSNYIDETTEYVKEVCERAEDIIEIAESGGTVAEAIGALKETEDDAEDLQDVMNMSLIEYVADSIQRFSEAVKRMTEAPTGNVETKLEVVQ